MRVLVTGATGFIGNHVVREMLQQGHKVIATSRNPEKARMKEWFSHVQYIPCDLNVLQKNAFQFFQEPEMMIHLAWEGLPGYMDMFHFEKNLFVNYQFLKTMIENGVEDMTVAGTSLEYGMQYGCLADDLATHPITPYGLAKDTLRKFLEQLQNKQPFSLKWIRIFYLYGEGQSEHSLLPLLEKAIQKGEKCFNLSGGEQLRDYLPVDTLAEYVARVALQNKIQGVINCCSGTPISIHKLVGDFLEKKQQNIQLNFGYYPYTKYEPMAFWGERKKLDGVLSGWQT